MKFIFTIFIALMTSSVFAQANCQNISQENEKLKKLLSLYNGHKVEVEHDIEFSFFKVVGNIKDQSIWVEFLVKNIDPIHKQIIFDDIDFIDEQSTSHGGSAIKFGNNYASSYNTAFSQVPIKVTAKIIQVAPSTLSYIKTITIKFRDYNDAFKYYNVAITGDKIDWK